MALTGGPCHGFPGVSPAIAPDRSARNQRLAVLAPDVVKAVLDGRLPKGAKLENLVRPLPVGWVVRRRMLRAGAAER